MKTSQSNTSRHITHLTIQSFIS